MTFTNPNKERPNIKFYVTSSVRRSMKWIHYSKPKYSYKHGDFRFFEHEGGEEVDNELIEMLALPLPEYGDFRFFEHEGGEEVDNELIEMLALPLPEHGSLEVVVVEIPVIMFSKVTLK